MPGKKKTKAEPGAKARRIARKVVGTIKPSRPIEPEDKRKKPKHKRDLLRQAEDA